MNTDKNEFLLQLDGLVRPLFVSGFLNQSVAIRAAFNELALRHITPQLDEIKICSVKDHKTWARDNGFRLIGVDLDTDAGSDRAHAQIYDPAGRNPFSAWGKPIEIYLSSQVQDAYVIQTSDVVVSHVRSFSRFDILARSNDLLLDDERSWLRYLEGKGIFRAVTPDLTKALIDFSGSREIAIRDKCAFIGSHPNWGHWMQDFLTKIAATERLHTDNNLKLVFGKLTVNQKDCLNLMGISSERIIELDLEVSAGEAVRYHFEDLICVPEIPKQAAHKYLRKRFAAADVGTPTEQPELVYLSRRSLMPRHRVSNIDEVENFFLAKGFTVINAVEKLSTSDLVALLRNVKILVMASGADLGNLVLCGEDPVVISLVSDVFLINSDPTLIPIWVKSIYGTGLSVVLVAGKCVADANISNNVMEQIDLLATYRIVDLEKALEQANKLGTKPQFP